MTHWATTSWTRSGWIRNTRIRLKVPRLLSNSTEGAAKVAPSSFQPPDTRSDMMSKTPTERIIQWLRDAHTMETEAETMLKAMSSRIEHYPDLKQRIDRHIE